MEACPFHYQSVSAAGKLAPRNLDGLNPVNGFMLAILSVEVWWRVVIVEHANHDAEELTYARQISSCVMAQDRILRDYVGGSA